MKSLKIAKFQVVDTIPAIRIYYGVFILIISLLAIAKVRTGDEITSSGLELASVIFLFIAGLNSFRSSFRFSQANNISRKTFFKGMILGIFPITLIMSVLDLVINRVYNIFVLCSTNFDMIYSLLRDTGMWNTTNGSIIWKPANDFATLFGTAIWQFAVYTTFFLVGILISLIYYRSNKLVKVIVSILPAIYIILLNITFALIPLSIFTMFGHFIANAFGWYSRNPYIAVFSFSILSMIISCFIYLLVRKAVVKD